MDNNTRLTPLPPTPRTKAWRERLAKLTGDFPLPDEFYDLLKFAEALEIEVAIASSGWSQAEKDVHSLLKEQHTLKQDANVLRKQLSDIKEVLNRTR